MDIITGLIDFVLHIDKHLGEIIAQYGTLTYAILFAIIFAETGFVVTPFLPGDSLLFAAGAFAAKGSLNWLVLIVLLLTAAVLGDAVNYWIGRKLGPAATRNPNSRVFKREYVEMTERFYEKHGGKAIVLARFVPIVRTFAPFMAGVGQMYYPRFAFFNIFGATIWVIPFVLGGYVFGSLPFVEENFSLVIIAIIILSVSPGIWHWAKSRLAKRRGDTGDSSPADDAALQETSSGPTARLRPWRRS